MFTPDIETNELKDHFRNLASMKRLQVLGCVHIGEKVCGVKDAVAEGKISRSRYDNYHLMYDELKQKRRY